MSLIPMDLVEIQCDRCGTKFCEGSDEFCSVLRENVEDYLIESDWESEGGNHLCFFCTPDWRENFEEGAKP